MRLRVAITAPPTVLPWPHVQAPGRDVIYRALTRSSPELAARLHDRGIDSRGRTPFAYSTPHFASAGRRRGVYTIGGSGFWDIASPLPEVVQGLLAGLAMTPVIDWAGTPLTVTGFQPLPAPTSGREAVWDAVTPITVKLPHRQPGQDHWLLPPASGWAPALTTNLTRKAHALGEDPDITVVEVLRFGNRRRIVRNAVGDVHDHAIGVPATVRVTGHPDTLTALRDWGLGSGNAAGFGWIA